MDPLSPLLLIPFFPFCANPIRQGQRGYLARYINGNQLALKDRVRIRTSIFAL